MIKLEGWHSERVEVEFDEGKIIDAVITMFRKRDNLLNVDGIDEKGLMFENCEYHTSHSWTVKEKRGKPSSRQEATLITIEELKILKKEFK